MRIYKIYFFILIFSIFGCGNNSKEVNKTKEKISKSPIKHTSISIKNEESNKSKDRVLNKLGIQKSSDGKIIIDPKKTKEFLEGMAAIFANEAQKIKNKNKDLTPKDLGVEVNGSKIIIDPQKGKSFLEEFSKELEEVGKDLKKSIDDLN